MPKAWFAAASAVLVVALPCRAEEPKAAPAGLTLLAEARVVAPAEAPASVGQGIFALDASFGRSPGAAGALASNLLWRYVTPAQAAR